MENKDLPKRCSCRGKDGKPKDPYPTKDKAQSAAWIRFSQSGENLRVYECPERNGWHMTKENEEITVYRDDL